MDDFDKVLDHAIKDHAFAQALKANPEEALKSIGVACSPQRIAALQAATEPLKQAHSAFGGHMAPD